MSTVCCRPRMVGCIAKHASAHVSTCRARQRRFASSGVSGARSLRGLVHGRALTVEPHHPQACQPSCANGLQRAPTWRISSRQARTRRGLSRQWTNQKLRMTPRLQSTRVITCLVRSPLHGARAGQNACATCTTALRAHRSSPYELSWSPALRVCGNDSWYPPPACASVASDCLRGSRRRFPLALTLTASARASESSS